MKIIDFKKISPQIITEKYIDPWLNKLRINPRFVRPVLAITIGFKAPERDTRVGGWGARISFGAGDNDSLFYNGALYVRLMLPFFIGVQIRWAGKNPTVREFLQIYVGWKFNGFLSAVVRVQSDTSAAAGFTAPNSGQAIGWQDGGK